MEPRRSLMVAVLGLLVSCDSEEKNPDDSLVQALSHVAEAPEQAKVKVNADEHMKKLQDKADADAEAAKQKAFAELVTVPSSLPADLKTACAQVSAAVDGFKAQRLSGSELDRWNAVKERDLEKIVESCTAKKSIEIAACQSHALGKASSMFVLDDLPAFLSECEDTAGSESH